MRRRKLMLPVQKPKRWRVRNVFRWIVYALLIFFSFLFANSGDYTKPLLLIPIALSIASVCTLPVAGAVGVFCGFLMDISGGTLLGFRAVFLFLICLGTQVAYDKLMTQHLLNTLLFTAGGAFLITGIDFVFRYVLFGYEHLGYLYTHYIFWIFFYTLVSAIFLHPIFYLVHKFLLPPRKRTVERTVRAEEE